MRLAPRYRALHTWTLSRRTRWPHAIRRRPRTLLRRALCDRKVPELRYDGYSRCVELHAVICGKAGEPMRRAWQGAGGGASGEKVGCKLRRLAEALGADISDEPSAAPRKATQGATRPSNDWSANSESRMAEGRIGGARSVCGQDSALQARRMRPASS